MGIANIKKCTSSLVVGVHSHELFCFLNGTLVIKTANHFHVLNQFSSFYIHTYVKLILLVTKVILKHMMLKNTQIMQIINELAQRCSLDSRCCLILACCSGVRIA
ncbi:hypothetical protein NIES2100_32040 [Calothrix sp. NIES-2100]|nr:hypothetical protein NIES2100_32040 [Calothrix sp. NIES-2100]